MQTTSINICHWSIPPILSDEPHMTPSSSSPKDPYSTATLFQQLPIPSITTSFLSSYVSLIDEAIHLETQPLSLSPSRPNDTEVHQPDLAHVNDSPPPILTT